MATMLAQMANGRAARSNSKINCSVPAPRGPGTGILGTPYMLVDCNGSVGSLDEVHSRDTDTYTFSGDRGGTADAYLLPWDNNKVCWMTLGAAHDKFATYSLNGCGVIILGDRTNPTVIHANENGTNEPDFALRCAIYDTVIANVAAAAMIAPVGDTAKWYPGPDYRGKGAVLGVRVSGVWHIYGHDQAGSNSSMSLIWPVDGVADDAGGCKCCFITTAVCQTMGLPDDCAELQALRAFRDQVMEQTPSGRRDIATYYATAPQLVAQIDRQPNAHELYRQLYVESIVPAVEAISRQDWHTAYQIYHRMMTRLPGRLN